MIFLGMIFKTVLLAVLIIIAATLQIWVSASIGAFILGGKLPSLFFLAALDRWPREIVGVFVVVLTACSWLLMKLWNRLGAWEYFYVYRLGKY